MADAAAADDPAAFKRELSRAHGRILVKLMERLNRDVEKIPAGSLPIAIAVIQDKKAAADGDVPVSIVEHRHAVLDLNRELERLESDPKSKLIDV